MFRFLKAINGEEEEETKGKIMKNVDTVKEQLAELSKSKPKLKASQSFRCDKLLQRKQTKQKF